MLHEMGHEAVGIEPDEKAREVAVSNGCKVYSGTAEDIPSEIRSEKFGVILMSHVLEHTLDPVLALQNVKNLISEGGKIIIEVPNNNALGCKILAENWAWLDVPRHLNFYTSKSLKIACVKAGFSIKRTEYRGFCRQFGKKWVGREARICKMLQLNTNSINCRLLDMKRWKLFFMSIYCPPDRKYDSVRLIVANE